MNTSFRVSAWLNSAPCTSFHFTRLLFSAEHSWARMNRELSDDWSLVITFPYKVGHNSSCSEDWPICQRWQAADRDWVTESMELAFCDDVWKSACLILVLSNTRKGQMSDLWVLKCEIGALCMAPRSDQMMGNWSCGCSWHNLKRGHFLCDYDYTQLASTTHS